MFHFVWLIQIHPWWHTINTQSTTFILLSTKYYKVLLLYITKLTKGKLIYINTPKLITDIHPPDTCLHLLEVNDYVLLRFVMNFSVILIDCQNEHLIFIIFLFWYLGSELIGLYFKNVWMSDKSWEPGMSCKTHSFNLSFTHSRHAEQLLFSCLCSKVAV